MQSIGSFGRRRIRNIDPWDVEQFLLNAIHEKELTQKGFSNLRTLIYGVFKQAKKQRLIDWSITDTIQDMDISRKAFRKITHEDDELVFSDDEKKSIYEAIDNMGYDAINLAIILLFKTGVRPGEVVALTRDDVCETKVHVSKTEIKRQAKKHIAYEVVDRTKTEAGVRDVPVPKDSAWLIKRILFQSQNGTYLFEINGKRVTGDQLRRRLRTLCTHANITHKSPNKIRKTYASTLLDSGVNKSAVTKVMGHTNIQTTETYYHKNRYSIEEIAEQINACNL